MMDVSKSWRDSISKFDDLFRHIAFDTSDPHTIATARRILRIVELKPTELEVFIRSTFRDLVGNTKLRVAAEELAHRLALQSGRFVYFELQTHSPRFGQYFNLPAPKLRFLHYNCTTSPVLFASSFPNLRTLHTSMNKIIKIPPSSLSNLVELQLLNSHRAQRSSKASIFALLRSTPRLEALSLSGFTWFSCVSTVPEPVDLANLISVHFTDCHLPEFLLGLRFPQLRKFSFLGSDPTPDENTPPSTVCNTNFFTRLQACPLPILDQRAVNHIFISTDDNGDKIEFTLRLVSGPDSKYQFTATMAWEKWENWEGHLEQFIGSVVKRVRLTSSVCLYLFHYVDHTEVPYLPLLRLPQINVLCTAGWFTPTAFKLLAGSGNSACFPPLPRLKCFCFRGDELQASTEEVQSSVEHCLRSRFDKRRPLAIRCWVPYGDETRLVIPR